MVASTRIERRRAARQQHILLVAARAFAARGLDGVRLDEIADIADVARGTLYAHFPTKQALLSAIVKPAIDAAAHGVASIREPTPRKAVRAVLRLHLELWRDHRDAMRVSHLLGSKPTGTAQRTHRIVLSKILGVFADAQRAGLLRTDDPITAARLLARLAVPLLDLLSDHPAADRLFVDMLENMLLRPRAHRR